MAKLVLTFTKQDQDPWVLFQKTDTRWFSDDEVVVLNAFAESGLRTLPGFVKDSIKVYVEGNTRYEVMEFTDNASALYAAKQLTPRSSDFMIVMAKANVIGAKLAALGVQPYQRSMDIIPDDVTAPSTT